MEKKSTLPELLAPAGNLETALAAFDAGADAVYGGLVKFNARERAANFSSEELGKLLSYAHGCGRRVYLTFNTLLREQELDEAAEFLAELARLRPDALIVQDLAVPELFSTTGAARIHADGHSQFGRGGRRGRTRHPSGDSGAAGDARGTAPDRRGFPGGTGGVCPRFTLLQPLRPVSALFGAWRLERQPGQMQTAVPTLL